ncbi:hypothetical protein [Pseudomonas sp. PSKL.D1]|uniref:hypothetical protein n=1 Tax=Pseudomonas sp. PSKL.D1 TaxID=3029060 RepID=UPI0023818B53|nr:hypothetical protein [Pseudomonas sp. PSKL.D1]WDY57211.1 hypothetical protein PVV54_21945 [Pseudomonas sp. PSKL.D1]
MGAEQKRADQRIARQKILDKLPKTQMQGGLNPLVISDMDYRDPESKGFGWNELSDATRALPMTSRLPEVFRLGNKVSLFWTRVEPTQPPTSQPEAPDDAPIQFYDLTADIEEQGWVSFTVTRDMLTLPAESGISYPYYGYFYYEIYDPDAETVRYSEYRTVLIDLRVPGGLDPDLSTPFNDNLFAPKIQPPGVIGRPLPIVTVEFTKWPFIQPDDLPILVWNGVRHEFARLTAEDIQNPLIYTVPPSVIEAGGSGERIPVYFEVRDLVQNYSRPSPSAFIEVADPDAYDAPTVERAQTPPYELDLVSLGGQDVLVIVSDPDIVSGDKVVLHWAGMTEDGQQVNYDVPEATAAGSLLLLYVPYTIAVLSVNGSARLYYDVNPGTGKRSLTRSITVKGLGIGLLAPIFRDADGLVIDLAKFAGDLVYVDIPLYPGQAEGDQVTLFWTGQVGEGTPMVYQPMLPIPPGGAGVPLAFPVDKTYLAVLVSGRLTLSYSVYSPSLGIRRPSPEITYSVVDNGAVDLPAPTCDELQVDGADVWLPVETPVAYIRVPSHAPLRQGEMVTLHFGLAAGVNPPPYEPSKQFQGFPFFFEVDQSVIEPFDGQAMSVTYSVDRGDVRQLGSLSSGGSRPSPVALGAAELEVKMTIKVSVTIDSAESL